MTPAKAKKIFKRFAQLNTNPKTELIYNSPFELLVAVILSAQSTDKSVNRATLELFKIANTPEKMLSLGEAGLKSYINKIGLYNNKAKAIIKTSSILLEKFHGKIPSTREALETLPGVGRKTANVILNVVFAQKTIAVDTHIFRVANRVGLACGKTPQSVERQLLQIIPAVYLQHAHHWLVLHGRYICVARKPRCAICPIVNLCEYKYKNFN